MSVAEIAAAVSRGSLKVSWRSVTGGFVILDGQLANDFFSRLAGTVKAAEVLGEAGVGKDELVRFLVQQTAPGERCEFGLSWHAPRAPRWLSAAGLELKKLLRERAGHVRYVVSREPALSAVVVTKNRLLPPAGYDFVVLPADDKLIVARTVWVQEFEAWSERDYGRPARDAKVGMLPPKLARIMLNLSQAPERGSVLDPFCGSGTVLQEAALLGYAQLVGADTDAKGVARSKDNLAWLATKHPDIPQPTLIASDIRSLTQALKGQTFDAIVTEPYLGPPLRGHEHEQRLRQIHGELTEFYKITLKVLSRLVRRGGRIVMVWPVIMVGRKAHPLSLMGALHETGLRIADVLPAEAPSEWRNDRGTLTYARPDARVEREIVVLERGT